MAMKRFVAPDMRRALDLVRQELGPDAIILSSQRTKEGVEIITSTEMDYRHRGAEEKNQFRQHFDEELDRPLGSDNAWQGQSEAPATLSNNPKPTIPSRLEAEIEAARKRMMAAKQATAIKPQKVRTAEPAKAKSSFIAMDELPQHIREQIQDSVHSSHTPAPLQQSAASGDGVDRQMEGLQEQVRRMADAQRHKDEEEEKMHALREEIADMRMLLQQQMWRMQNSDSATVTPESPLIGALKEHLTSLGLPNELSRKLLRGVQPGQRLNAAWRNSLAHLTKAIQVDNSDPIGQGGVFAFVGPTGVGKTTSIAKLAARYVLQHGFGKVALVTTDTFRVGAHDQLKSLGRILNVPVRVVDKERSLAAVVASLKDYPLVLIDTAGFRQGDPLLKEQEAMLASCPSLQRILVLASNSQRQTLKASAHAFKNAHLRGCILTKLDETASLGEILGVVVEQQLSLLYCADGQAIPNDIQVSSSAHLVAKAVQLMKQQRDDSTSLAVGQTV